MTTATAITVDRDLVERVLVEFDAIATFDEERAGASETWLQNHIYGLLDELEREFGLRPMSDEDAERLHERGIARGHELFHQFVTPRGRDDAG
jgi:hypothetical protein